MDYDVENGQKDPVNPCKVDAALCQKWEAPHIKQFRWHSDLCDAVPQVISNIYRNCKYCTFTASSTLTYIHTLTIAQGLFAQPIQANLLKQWLPLSATVKGSSSGWCSIDVTRSSSGTQGYT